MKCPAPVRRSEHHGLQLTARRTILQEPEGLKALSRKGFRRFAQRPGKVVVRWNSRPAEQDGWRAEGRSVIPAKAGIRRGEPREVWVRRRAWNPRPPAKPEQLPGTESFPILQTRHRAAIHVRRRATPSASSHYSTIPLSYYSTIPPFRSSPPSARFARGRGGSCGSARRR